MIVIVDGTGNSDPQKYDREMLGSFCDQLRRADNSTYLRGPSLFGWETSDIADIAVNAVRSARRNSGDSVMLAGHSRGGCAVILAAKRLQALNIDVSAMFLFDAVDIQASDPSLSRTVPSNVAFVAHARSARDLLFWAKNPRKSRFYFYNTGVDLAEHPAAYVEHAFIGSHSAVGGLPWQDIPTDVAIVTQTADWMNDQMKAHGLLLKNKLKWSGEYAKNL
jgi:dienelactone hydrolase